MHISKILAASFKTDSPNTKAYRFTSEPSSCIHGNIRKKKKEEEENEKQDNFHFQKNYPEHF